MTTRDPYRTDLEAAAAMLPDDLAGLLILDPYDPGDPWGSVMGARFALNDALGLVGGETDPTYRPSTDPEGVLREETYGGGELLDTLRTSPDVIPMAERADRALDALTDRLEADGRSY